MSAKESSVKGLSGEERERIKEIFKLFTSSQRNEGFSLRDLQEVMQSYGMNPTTHEVKDLIDEIDITGNEFVTFDLFLEAFFRKLKDSDAEEDLREAFKVFDRTGNGFISVDELRIAMTEWGEGLTSEEFDEMITELDFEHNQEIDFEEFITIVTSTHKSK